MSWATHGTFVLFAALVVIASGPDFAVVVKNSLARGRGAGLATGTPTIDALLLAYTHAVLGVIWLMALVAVVHRLRPWIQRCRVRRTLESITGTALIAFASLLAVESR